MSQSVVVRGQQDAEPKAGPAIVANGEHFLRLAERGRAKAVTCTIGLFLEICELLTEGASIQAICARSDMPSLSAFWRFMQAQGAETWDVYVRARGLGAHAVAAFALNIAGEATAEDATAARLKYEAYRWYAGKLAPREYGDRLEGAKVENNQTVIFQVTK
jgi:Bacteriophage Sf6, terminase small subunit-like